MDADTELPSADVPHDGYERQLPAEDTLQRWLFFDANRWSIIGLLLAGTLLAQLAFVGLGVVQYRDANAIQLLMSAFIAGNFTLVTIVITVNQLVLSREFGKPHTLRDRNAGIQSFRNDVTDAADLRVPPPAPLGFLRTIVGALHDHATRLGDLATDVADAELAAEVDGFASAVRDQTGTLDDDIADVRFGQFDLLVSLLFYRVAWQIHAARRLRDAHGASLPADAVDRLDDIQTLLRQLNVARQYLQTLYLQRELAKLSRLLLYVGVPVLLVSTVTMLVYPTDPRTVSSPLVLQVGIVAVSTVAFAPLAILLAYVVRISTIVSRMAMLSPFISNG